MFVLLFVFITDVVRIPMQTKDDIDRTFQRDSVRL